MFFPLNHPLRIIFLSVVLLSKVQFTSAQTEWLVNVDPSNGSLTKIDSIPGVMWILLSHKTTIDEKNKHFIFVGGPTQTDFDLITLNAVYGNTINKVPFSINNNTNKILNLVFSRYTNKLYGLLVNAGVYSLATVNKESGMYYLIKNIPDIDAISDFVLDDTNHRVFLKGLANGNLVLVTVDVLTGNVIARAPFSRISSMVYDNLTNKLYGLLSGADGASAFINLVSVNPETGTFSTIGSLSPEVKGVHFGNETYNEKDHLLIFTAEDNAATKFLYSVDVNTANVIHKVPVSMTNIIDKDNLTQFRFDNTAGKLYALYWEGKTIPNPFATSCQLNAQTKLYPNPFSGFLIVQKNPTTCIVRMNLYGAVGQVMIKDKIINDGKNEIKLQNLPGGMYFYKFYADGNILLTGKIIKQ